MMKPNKQGLILCMLIGLFMVLSLFIIPVSAEEIPVAAREAGENGYKSFLKSIPLENLKDFNFSDQDEIDQAVIGDPFKVYTIKPEEILNYNPDTSVEGIISQTSKWFVPVISKGETRTFLIVDLIEGEWKAVGIGSSGLAKEWASALKTYPSSQGFKHTFLRIYQAASDFILLSKNGETQMVPMVSGRITLELGEGKGYSPSDIILGLQEPVRKNLSTYSSPN